MQSSGRNNTMHACLHAWKDARADLDTPINNTGDRCKAAAEKHKISTCPPCS